ncbi:hypothetical protein AWB76_02836 [Caballeronia temeraria]|uniref:Uncharacterized protein n=1 Tax=Caballeronia temeraria TaxID=1777137 RepID=A0A158AQK7_9BURK|nr:hypothetical protein [Caballeronia temeraria]SAK60072.1 hypothetical protein AWB76_02836 [Caballeronia temeraria]
METLLISMLIGVLAGVPAWFAWQRAGARRGLMAARGFDPRDAAPCRIEPVALNARLLPEVDAAKDASRP